MTAAPASPSPFAPPQRRRLVSSQLPRRRAVHDINEQQQMAFVLHGDPVNAGCSSFQHTTFGAPEVSP